MQGKRSKEDAKSAEMPPSWTSARMRQLLLSTGTQNPLTNLFLAHAGLFFTYFMCGSYPPGFVCVKENSEVKKLLLFQER